MSNEEDDSDEEGGESDDEKGERDQEEVESDDEEDESDDEEDESDEEEDKVDVDEEEEEGTDDEDEAEEDGEENLEEEIAENDNDDEGRILLINYRKTQKATIQLSHFIFMLPCLACMVWVVYRYYVIQLALVGGGGGGGDSPHPPFSDSQRGAWTFKMSKVLHFNMVQITISRLKSHLLISTSVSDSHSRCQKYC